MKVDCDGRGEDPPPLPSFVSWRHASRAHNPFFPSPSLMEHKLLPNHGGGRGGDMHVYSGISRSPSMISFRVSSCYCLDLPCLTNIATKKST